MGNYQELKDKQIFPNEDILKELFGKKFSAYCELLELYNINYEWIYYNDVRCWLCKAFQKKKTIVWMSAMKGFIKATIYFQNKYLDELAGLKVSDELKKSIHDSSKTGKSIACTFEIKSKKILRDFNTVM